MSISPSAENLMLGAGNVYFDKLISPGVWDVSRHLGNCSSFTLHTEVLRKEVTKLMTSITDLPKYKTIGFKVTGSIKLDEISKENLALLLAGSVNTTYTQPAMSGAVYSYTSNKNTLIKLGQNYLSCSNGYNKRIFKVTVLSVKHASTTFIEGRDYTVNKEAGLLFISPASTINNGTIIEVTVNVPEQNIPQISIADNVNIAGQIMFVGDPTTGSSYLCSIKHAELSFDGGVSLIGEEFTSLNVNFIVTEHDVNALDGSKGFYNVIELPKS